MLHVRPPRQTEGAWLKLRHLWPQFEPSAPTDLRHAPAPEPRMGSTEACEDDANILALIASVSRPTRRRPRLSAWSLGICVDG